LHHNLGSHLALPVNPQTGISGHDKGEVVLNKSVYAACPGAHFGEIHDLSDEYVRVLMVGHNPSLEELVELLTGEIHLMFKCSLSHVKLRDVLTNGQR